MSNERVTRANRLVGLRGRAVESAQRELSDAYRDLAAARENVDRTERLWKEHAESFARGEYRATGDMADEHAYLLTLRFACDQALLQLQEARVREAEKRKALLEAKSELRKMELWRDALLERAAAVALRQERIASDETAARIVRRGR